MNCYRHPMEKAVSTCSSGCGRGLCTECCHRYGHPPFCEDCFAEVTNQFHTGLAEDRGVVIRQLIINSIILGTLIIGILTVVTIASTSTTGQPPSGMAFVGLLVIPTLYWSFTNFRKLMDKFSEWTGLMFFTSLNNWLMVFIFGTVLVAPLAPIILPINIIWDVKRLRDLS